MKLAHLRQLLSPLRPVIAPMLRPIRWALRHYVHASWQSPSKILVSGQPPPPTVRTHHVHDLTMNHALSLEEYESAVQLAGTLQALYDDAPSYLTRNGLDPGIFLPQGEWASIIPPTGLKFKTTYNDINYLRLHAPFAGYHLAVLDRLDSGGKFPRPEAEAFVTKLASEVPDDVAEQQKRFDLSGRLQHMIPEYLDHIRNIPKRYIVQTPRIFGEIGLDINGTLVHNDVMLCQSRINGLYCSGILEKIEHDIKIRGRARILEIGAGYGALAYAMQRIFEDRLEYITVDLPSSLWYSAIYLSTLTGGQGCQLLKSGDTPPEHFRNLFISNHLFDHALPSLGPIDVAINTMSFSEMSADQIRYYGNAIKQLIGRDGVLFEENFAPYAHHVDNKAIFSNVFPYHRKVSSNNVTTKNWCQDVWANRYLGTIFNHSDVSAIN
jgi:hypothetical protein